MPSYPEVRNASSSSNINSNAEPVKAKRPIKTTDYSSWDKYDPDAELLLLEIEEERKKAKLKEEKERKEKEENERRAQDLSKISSESMLLSSAEREKIAEDKRVKGNEYFKAKDFHLAIKYYSESIAIQETAAAFCNRALVYMKLNENFQAVNDCTACLHYEPHNVKALFRRAQALQSMKQYYAALKDITYLLEIEPCNLAAIAVRNSLLNMIGNNHTVARRNLHKKRIMVEDDDSYSDGCVKIIEVTEDELHKYGKYEYVELNEKNQLKEMCMCSLDSSYHRRSEELFRTNNSLISSPFYRITRVKHCYPVKVDMNRPSTSAVINSNYLHVGINANYRTPVRNIFVVPETEKSVFNSSYLSQRTSSAVPSTNLNKMFDFRPKQNINESITAQIPHAERREGVLKKDLQKIMDVSRGIAEKKADNLSTRLEILEIDSSVEKSSNTSSSNCKAINSKSQSLLNGNYEDVNSSEVNKVNVSSSSCGQQDTVNNKLSPHLQKNSDSHKNVSFNECNGTERLNGNASSEKSKFTLKQTNGLSINDISMDTNSNIANNNSPISPQCHGDDESGSQKKFNSIVDSTSATKANGFKHSSEDLRKCDELCESKGQGDSNTKLNSKNINGHVLPNGQSRLKPFQFLSRWQNVEKSKGLSEYETLLRQIAPSDLSSVISNQLDDRMLSTMLSVFRSCFNLKEEFSLVIDYLIAIAELERFGLVLCLLAPTDVKVARGLFSDLETSMHVDLQQLSQFIQLKQAYLC